MLSKEEIEKAKKMLNNPKKEDLIEIIRIFKRNGIENYCITKNEAIEALLQYIDQLEQEKNKRNKIIDEMAKEINETDPGYNDYCNSTRECTEKECENCIKQYFEKKVEGKLNES